MSRHPFIDPISGREVALVNDPGKDWWAGGVGVEHPGCAQLADLMPELDCFYCTACRWNGRVTGAWAVDIRNSEVVQL